MVKLGEKIRMLRKQKNISQETLATYLGVSYQAVSKWENETTMPDVTLIPAIAYFFGVSADELFDFNMYELICMKLRRTLKRLLMNTANIGISTNKKASKLFATD